MAKVIGQVDKTALSGFDYEWHIQHFFKFTKSLNKSYSSPSFYFAGHTWCLKIYINKGRKDSDIILYKPCRVGHIGLYLRRLSPGTPINLEFYLGLKSSDGRNDPELHRSFNFQKAETGYGMSRYLSLRTLNKQKADLLPSGVLTVVCTLKCPESVRDKHIKSLSQDYKSVLLNGTNHDLIFKVGDKELKAHKDILMSRSQVFQSMLSHDMTEKNSGTIDVSDCDPQAMEIFLLYVYSGKVESLDQSNMFTLYYIADKYDMKDLKEECAEFIKRSLSPMNVCEAIKTATNHNDTDLLENASDYFRNNSLKIMRTPEWLSFLQTDVNLANELIVDSLLTLKESYCHRFHVN